MNQYELLFIVDPKLPEEELNSLQDRLTALITSNQGEIVSTDTMGIRRLTFPIKKLDEGRYLLLYFKSAPALIPILDKQMKLLQQVMRFIIVKQEV